MFWMKKQKTKSNILLHNVCTQLDKSKKQFGAAVGFYLKHAAEAYIMWVGEPCLATQEASAVDSHRDPCGTYIFTVADQCTFQLSFQERHISSAGILAARLALSRPRAPGRWCRGSVDVCADCHFNPFGSENRSTCCAIRPLLVWGQVGVRGSCLASSYFVGCRLSIIGLFDSIRGSEVTAGAASCNVTSVWNYMFGLQPDAHGVNKEGGLPCSPRSVLVKKNFGANTR